MILVHLSIRCPGSRAIPYRFPVRKVRLHQWYYWEIGIDTISGWLLTDDKYSMTRSIDGSHFLLHAPSTTPISPSRPFYGFFISRNPLRGWWWWWWWWLGTSAGDPSFFRSWTTTITRFFYTRIPKSILVDRFRKYIPNGRSGPNTSPKRVSEMRRNLRKL